MDQINKFLAAAEKKLKALQPTEDASISYWSDSADRIESHRCIGLVKYQGAWRICHRSYEQDVISGDCINQTDWIPLADCSRSLRVEVACLLPQKLPQLQEAIVKNTEDFVPKANKALVALTEALALAGTAPASVSTSANGTVLDGDITDGRYKNFVEWLNPTARAVVGAIVSAYPSYIGTDDVAAAAGIKRTSLPPVFKQIRSAATKANLNPNEVIHRQQDPVSVNGYKAESLYRVSPEAAVLAQLLPPKPEPISFVGTEPKRVAVKL